MTGLKIQQLVFLLEFVMLVLLQRRVDFKFHFFVYQGKDVTI